MDVFVTGTMSLFFGVTGQIAMKSGQKSQSGRHVYHVCLCIFEVQLSEQKRMLSPGVEELSTVSKNGRRRCPGSANFMGDGADRTHG